MRNDVDGILLLDKPIDMTSNAALQRVKRLYAAKKAGHTGSLDPIATGMLPLCFGKATKYSQFLLDSNKSYYVGAQLGVQTKTGDCEGEVCLVRPVVNVDTAAIQQTMQRLLGAIEQIPPMYSAIKFQGRPLYELARKDIEIERKPRTVTIYSMALESLQKDHFTFHVHCSKGTYVRTLVEEIGNQLGCGAHVSMLRRLAVTPYQDKPMYTLAELEDIAAHQGHEGLLACLLPLESAVQSFPAVQLSTTATFYLRQGQAIRSNEFPGEDTLVRLIADDTTFLGIGELSCGLIKPRRLVFSNA